jgi:hypothetical protein
MTMGFPVSEEVDLDDLGVDDEIMFDIEMMEPGSHRIFRVEKVDGAAQ